MSGIEIALPKDPEAPNWVEGIILHREGDEIVIEVVRKSGTQLCESRVSLSKFKQIVDLLFTEFTE